MSEPKRRVLFAGGGTAGHVFPALAVARALQAMAPDIEPVFIGTADRLEGRLVPQAGFRFHHVDMLPLPRRISFNVVRLPMAIRSAVRRCEEIIREENAVGAATFGGYVSFPLDYACGRLQLPLVLHEQNAKPGLANRVAARWADRIAVTFPGSADEFGRPELVAVTGNPVRDEMLELDREEVRAEALKHFRLHQRRRTVLVFGGSQGARSINRAAVASHGLWDSPKKVQILHAAGSSLYRETAAAWEEARRGGEGPLVRCVDFIDDMGLAYAAADVVVCRAGATSIAELTALGVPSVLVPYPHATRDHQMANGRALERAGGAVVIPDEDVDGTSLRAAVEPLLEDDDERTRVSAASRAFGRRDAAHNVAKLLLDQLRTPADRSAAHRPDGSAA